MVAGHRSPSLALKDQSLDQSTALDTPEAVGLLHDSGMSFILILSLRLFMCQELLQEPHLTKFN